MTTRRDRWGFNNCDYMFAAIENPFPLNPEFYVGGRWWSWVERIHQGQREEQERIRTITQKMPREVAEWYADDYYEAEDISDSMFAALTVAIIANIESLYHHCMLVCEQASMCQIGKLSAYKYGDVKEYFRRSIRLDLGTCDNSLEVQSIRGLQNAFKHNNGQYVSTSRSPIDPALAEKWGLIDGKMIEYSKLPIDELLFASGKYCASFLERVRCALEKR